MNTTETKQKHTGGNWTAEPSSNEKDFIIRSTNTLSPIAMTCEEGVAERFRNYEVAEANAKLMAAAPAMHEALQDVLDSDLLMDDERRANIQNLLNSIQTATN